MHHGYFPENGIDHKDRDKLNNRIENLREVSKQCNSRNAGNRADNASGIKGAWWNESRNKWRVDIRINNKSYHLGRFDDFTEAVATRLAAEQCIGWEDCESNSPACKFMQEYLKKR